jgi:hypothetical protein
MTRALAEGDELKCPHCRRWHPVKRRHDIGTPYTRLMLYFECQRGSYFAGTIGTPSRHETRPSTN